MTKCAAILSTNNCHRHYLRDELRILLVHGVLHLLGHDHELGVEQHQRMSVREKEILAALEWQVSLNIIVYLLFCAFTNELASVLKLDNCLMAMTSLVIIIYSQSSQRCSVNEEKAMMLVLRTVTNF